MVCVSQPLPVRFSEEFPMTIQVGMVGTNGVLLAGDTQWTQSPLVPGRGWVAGRYAFNRPKIIINHERGIAIACARDMITASLIARKVITDLKDDDLCYPKDAIEKIAAEVATLEGQRNEAHCLIAMTRPVVQLFFLQFVN